MKQDKYSIEKWIDQLQNNKHTGFLDQHDQNILIPILNKNKIKYKIYEPYKDADHIIIYKEEIPKIDILKIECKHPLKHNEILGSIYNLNIQKEYFGDILISNQEYYVLCLPQMTEYIKHHLIKISKYTVNTTKVEKDISTYQKEYTTHQLITNSLRIDNIISKITNLSRNDVIKKIHQKEVILNGEILTNKSKELKENDTFSIRKFGKYRYIETNKITKKNNLIIKYIKYQ